MINTENQNEYLRCLLSPKYAIENYLKVCDYSKNSFINLNLNDNQNKLIDNIEFNKFNYFKTTRQTGLTTGLSSYLAIKMCFDLSGDDKTFVYLTNKISMSNYFINMVREHLLNLPRWVWGEEFYGTPEKEKKSIFLKNDKLGFKLINGNSFKIILNEHNLYGSHFEHIIVERPIYNEYNFDTFSIFLKSRLTTNGKITISSNLNDYNHFPNFFNHVFLINDKMLSES